MPTQRIVFAGGPGSGKTTLLRALELRGYAVVADSARSIIQARRSRSLSPRPAPLEFAEAILRQDIQQYGEQGSCSGRVFFERGIVDVLGMLHELGGLPEQELQAFLSAYRYHRQVFIFPPWVAIYPMMPSAIKRSPKQSASTAECLHGISAAGTSWSRCQGPVLSRGAPMSCKRSAQPFNPSIRRSALRGAAM